MISFVIPAHNEELALLGTLDALISSAEQIGQAYEVIVVNDSSTDRTGQIASDRGVRVIDVQYRQIAATRNAGVRAARGEILFFVDADTQASTDAIRGGLAALEQGAIGGACQFQYAGQIPLWAQLLLPIGNAAARLLKVAGGAFIFCRRSEFEAIGGFCERYFAAEDLAFVKALKQRGRFVIPRAKVLTSNRKLRKMSLSRALVLLLRVVASGPESFVSREGLGLWYGPEARDKLPNEADNANGKPGRL